MFTVQTATVSLPNDKRIKATSRRRRKKQKERRKGISNSVIQVTATVTPDLWGKKVGLKKKKKNKETKSEKEENKKPVKTGSVFLNHLRFAFVCWGITLTRKKKKKKKKYEASPLSHVAFA